MVDLVIFGTGSNGERAWQAATATPEIRVVCFVDNDSRKHGTVLNGRPVISPDQLLGVPNDVVVVASMFAADIVPQLIASGVSPASIIAPPFWQFHEAFAALPAEVSVRRVELDDDRKVDRCSLPRVLILTHETLNNSHGTGVLIQRSFLDFPVGRLFSVSLTANGEPWLANSLGLSASTDDEKRQASLTSAFRQASFTPDVVYATAFNEIDLALLESVLAVIPETTPVVQHFMDFIPHDAAAFAGRFKALSHRVDDVWALTRGMADALATCLGRPVRHVSALYQDPAPARARAYRAFSADFRAAIVGNVWDPRVIPFVREVWRRCQRALPELAALDWYVHPTRAQAAIEAGCDLGDELRWRGFYPARALQARLDAADLAVLPFNLEAEARHGYARFSLPSRLTELCGAGLPIVAIASPDTEPARFLAERRCGLAVSGPDADTASEAILAFVRDREKRERFGRAARRIAECEFALEPFQRWFVGSLVRLTEPEPAITTKALMTTLEGSEQCAYW